MDLTFAGKLVRLPTGEEVQASHKAFFLPDQDIKKTDRVVDGNKTYAVMFASLDSENHIRNAT